MYISLLDYLEEIKKKFYVIILMIVLFLVISVGYKFYKNNNYELSFSKNLQSLSTLTLSKYNFKSSPQLAVEWISYEANKRYNEENKLKNLLMKCKKDSAFLNCKVSGKIKSDADLNEIKNKMYLAISDALENYRIYIVKIIDEIIISKQDLLNFVLSAEDTNLEIQARYKSAVSEIVFTKNLFVDLMNKISLAEDDIIISKTDTKINYILIILSGLISGLFLIFLQMTGRKN